MDPSMGEKGGGEGVSSPFFQRHEAPAAAAAAEGGGGGGGVNGPEKRTNKRPTPLPPLLQTMKSGEGFDDFSTKKNAFTSTHHITRKYLVSKLRTQTWRIQCPRLPPPPPPSPASHCQTQKLPRGEGERNREGERKRERDSKPAWGERTVRAHAGGEKFCPPLLHSAGGHSKLVVHSGAFRVISPQQVGLPLCPPLPRLLSGMKYTLRHQGKGG